MEAVELERAGAPGAPAAAPWLGRSRQLAATVGPAAAVGAALALPLAYAPPLQSVFSAPKLAILVLAGAAGVAGQALAMAARAPAARWPRPLAIALGAVLLTSLGASVVAWLRGPPGAPYAASELVRLVAVAGVALAVARAGAPDGPPAEARGDRWTRRLFEAVLASTGIVAVIGLLQHVELLPLPLPVISVPGSTFGNRNMAGEAVALALPLGLGAIAAGGRGRIGSALLVAVLAIEVVYLAVTRTRGAWAGGAMGIAAFAVLYRPGARAGRRRIAALALALAAAALLAALLPGRWTPRDARDSKRYEPGYRVVLDALDPAAPVVRTRLGLWRRTLALWGEHPLTGVGAGNFAVLFPRHAEPGATADGVLTATMVPRRAHSDLLERLAETGPLGLAALLALYAAAARTAAARARRPGAFAAAAAGGTLAAAFGAGLFGFPLATPATAFLFAVALGTLAAGGTTGGARADVEVVGPAGARTAAPPTAAPGGWRLLVGGAAACAVLVGAAFVSSRMLAASYWWARGESALRAGDAPRASDAMARARRAADAAPVAPDGTGSFGVALRAAQIDLRQGHALEAARAAADALAIEPYSPHAFATLAAARIETGDAPEAAIAARRALELLADYPAAQATLQRVGAPPPREP